jgi:hypothetical protein
MHYILLATLHIEIDSRSIENGGTAGPFPQARSPK